ncbi:MAG: ZIP family metal transporter [Gammaproteobacteria bacterium]
MTNWAWMLVLTGCGAFGSALGATALAALSKRTLTRLVPGLVSFSTGVLLGAACLDLLPTAFAHASGTRAINLGLALALGILCFFALEKLIHWHHGHDVVSAAETRSATDRATVVSILTGTSLHNFLAGVLLAAALLENLRAALILFAAVLAHHIPQQVGDFSVLLMAGYKRRRALALTIASSAAMLAGGVLSFWLLAGARPVLPFVLVVAAASLLYIAAADLIPRLRSRNVGRHALAPVLLVALGIGVIYAVVRLLPG